MRDQVAGAVRRAGRVAARLDHQICGADPSVDPLAAQQALIDILNQEDKNSRYDLQTQAIIHRVLKPGSLGIDVGAHEGIILDHMIAASPGTPHIAVEPLPHLFDALVERYPGINAHRAALVENPSGDVEFRHVVTNPGYSGLRERRYDRPDEEVEVISVPTVRLDDLVPADADPRLIKIDVEGAEMGVLLGARETITRCKPVVVFEHGLGAADFYGTRPEDIAAFFEECGLSVSLLGSYLEDGPPLSVEQFADQYDRGLNYYFLARP